MGDPEYRSIFTAPEMSNSEFEKCIICTKDMTLIQNIYRLVLFVNVFKNYGATSGLSSLRGALSS